MTYILRVSLFVLAGIFLIPNLSHAVTITVTNLNNAGPGSLRQAILDSNATPGVDDEIVFQEGLSGTILMAGSEMDIRDDVTITGPPLDMSGVPQITIDANATQANDRRIFDISLGINLVVSISRIRFVNGFEGRGGAILNNEELTIESCIFEENTSQSRGGAIYNEGTITEIANSTFYMNMSVAGGAIYNEGSIGIIKASTFEMNESTGLNTGGAINNEGTLAITQSTFTGNIATRGLGGAIDNSGTLAITHSTFTGNTADQDGGAIRNSEFTTTISHSTFTGNTAEEDGGAIFTGTNATTNISFSTIVNNTATVLGGGLFTRFSGELTIKNSIVGDNSGGDCDIVEGATFTGLGNNLDSDGTCAALSGTFNTAAPELDPAGLQDNGGPTETIALCTGVNTPTAGCAGASPALNTVTDCTDIDDSPVTVDQRFFPRPYPNPGNCDIGAFEDQPTGMLSILKTGTLGTDFEFTGTGFPTGCSLEAFTLDTNDTEMCTLPEGNYTVEEMPSPEFELAGIECDKDPVEVTDTGVEVNIEGGDNVTCSFENTAALATLDLTFSGSGGGMVNLSPPDVDCTTNCSELYPSGTDLTLMATPDAVSFFVGFTGDPDCTDEMVTMDADKTCIATFNFVDLILNPIWPGIASNFNIISAEQASPNGDVAFVWGFFTGSTSIGGPTCNGLVIDIQNPRLLSIVSAGVDQIAEFIFYIPLIGDLEIPIRTQAIDVPTCRKSDPRENIIRKE